jgi:hypothetical protein
MVIGLQVGSGFALGPLNFGIEEFRLDCHYHAVRHLILQIENVSHLAVEPIGPYVRAVCGVDQLAGDTHSVAGLANATFQYVADPERTPYLPDVRRFALVGKAGIASNHEQPAHARESRNKLLHHAVGKIFLLGVAAHVLERQHGY